MKIHWLEIVSDDIGYSQMTLVTYGAMFESWLDLLKTTDGGPALSDQTVVRHVKVTHVEGVVNRLNLLDLDNPRSYLFLSTHQHPFPVILSLVQHL